VANWEGLALCEDYQTKGHGTKGKIHGFLKDLFITEISNFFKKTPFLVILNYVNNSKTCTWQSV